MGFRVLCGEDECWEGEMKGFTLDGRKILLINEGGRLFAYENRCGHLGLPLSGGRVENGILTCPAHHWQYEVKTGCGVNPQKYRLQSFAVKAEGGSIWIDTGETKS